MLSNNGIYENKGGKIYSKSKLSSQIKSGLIASTDLVSHDYNKLYKYNKYISEIYKTDNQITHDNHTSVLEKLKISLLSAATVLINSEKYKLIRNDKDRIVEFPGIAKALISQINSGITKRTILNSRLFNMLFKRLGKRMGNFASKTKLELRIRTVVLLCDLAEKMHYYIYHTGSREQLEAYENSLFFRLFMTPRVASVFLGADEDVIKSNICNALDPDLCVCLLSMLDKSNFYNYLYGIKDEMNTYFNKVCNSSYDEKISVFLNKQYKYFSKEERTEFNDFEKSCAGFSLVLWMVISGLSESVISSNGFKPMSVELTRKLVANIISERNKYSFDAVSARNHMLTDVKIEKSNVRNKLDQLGKKYSQ